MKRILFTLAALGAGLLAVGCDDSGANSLVAAPREFSVDPSSLAAPGNTQHHFKDPNIGTNGITDPTQVVANDQSVGSPEVVARLHACSKMPVASLGNILASRGVNVQADANGNPTAGTIYQNGMSAMGVASYSGRVPEDDRPVDRGAREDVRRLRRRGPRGAGEPRDDERVLGRDPPRLHRRVHEGRDSRASSARRRPTTG